MTVREVINFLINTPNKDDEFTVEVPIKLIEADKAKGKAFSQLGVSNIINCYRGSIAISKERKYKEKE